MTCATETHNQEVRTDIYRKKKVPILPCPPVVLTPNTDATASMSVVPFPPSALRGNKRGSRVAFFATFSAPFSATFSLYRLRHLDWRRPPGGPLVRLALQRLLQRPLLPLGIAAYDPAEALLLGGDDERPRRRQARPPRPPPFRRWPG
ncbi:uncharacterized protein MKK02DRAFT_29098 [Dioszegia hungarica]|uniref:Uncharacterized protein n=1 Tax=Dioszegia hungarica TaxID=4972 RepID=A0AA38LQE9_9TREE|nr:uncharacterized protein MKK02DRAFT_29098 [Dioszegia hungarica]KAI9633222.1 hypothetical protein MKK02DRAFT_29098 [Dioszegia hungarica]